MEETTPKLPKKFTNLMGMGEVVQVFQAKTALFVRIILSAFLLLAGGGATGYALYILWQRWGRYYPPQILKDIAPWLTGALLAFLLAGLLLRELLSLIHI